MEEAHLGRGRRSGRRVLGASRRRPTTSPAPPGPPSQAIEAAGGIVAALRSGVIADAVATLARRSPAAIADQRAADHRRHRLPERRADAAGDRAAEPSDAGRRADPRAARAGQRLPAAGARPPRGAGAMTAFPDFATLAFDDAAPPPAPPRSAEATAGRRRKASRSSRPTAPPTSHGLDFPAAIPASRRSCAAPTRPCTCTNPWTIRQYAGFSTAEDSNAFYRRNLAAGQMGLSVAFDLATHRGYDSDHPRVKGDVGMAGRGHRLHPRHAHPVLRHPARQDERVDDHERRGAADPGALHRRRRGAGRAARRALRHHPERHPQGVHGPEHLHLSARALDADHLGHLRLHRRRRCRSSTRISISGYHMQEAGASLDLELAYTLADGIEYVRAGVAAGHDRRRLRAAPVVLLERRHELLHGGGQAARRAPAVGQADAARTSTRRTRARCPCAPTPRPAAGAWRRRTCSTTSPAPRSRPWRRSAARPRACTPIRSTKPLPCRPTSPPASPATPSCSCRSRAA